MNSIDNLKKSLDYRNYAGDCQTDDMVHAILDLAERVEKLALQVAHLRGDVVMSDHCTCGGPAWLPRETDSEGNAQLCCEDCGKQKAGDDELINKYLGQLNLSYTIYGTEQDIIKDILRDLIREARGQEERG